MTAEEKELEKTRTRIVQGSMVCCCLGPVIMTATWCGLYWKMWSEMQEFDDRNLTINEVHVTYDDCGGALKNDLSIDTQWSVILGFNSILNLILMISMILTCIGSVFMPILFVGCCG